MRYTRPSIAGVIEIADAHSGDKFRYKLNLSVVE